MKFFKLIPVYNVRIIYKSGYFHDIEMLSFSYTPGEKAKWEVEGESKRILSLGIDEIAAVYQLGIRKKIVWG
jgi:hypothetical protein